MVKLTPEKARQIVEKILKDDYEQNWSRYIISNYYSKIRGWQYQEDLTRIIIITSRLYNKAPYQRNKSQITIYANKVGNIQKLKKWAIKNKKF